MDWREPVFDYCERIAGGLWAEPLNAISNVSFLIAAGAALEAWRRRPADPPALFLIFNTAVIGAGSFIFHTVATQGAMLLDVLPIALFIYFYFFLAQRRFLGLGQTQATGATVLFALVSQLVSSMAWEINGSIVYLPAFCSLIFFSIALSARSRQFPGVSHFPLAAGRLIAATTVFAASLGFRTFDQAVCGPFPIGTHFVWHLLNAVTLWLLIDAAMLAGERGEGDEPGLKSGDPEPESEETHYRMRSHDRP